MKSAERAPVTRATAAQPARPQTIRVIFDGGVRGKLNRRIGYGRFVFDSAASAAPSPEWLGQGDCRNFGLYKSPITCEYLALAASLSALCKRAANAGIDPRTLTLALVTDSEVLAKQLGGDYATDAPHLRHHQGRILSRLAMFGAWSLRWLPRERINALLKEAPGVHRAPKRPQKLLVRERRRASSKADAAPADSATSRNCPVGRPRVIRLPKHPAQAQIEACAVARAEQIIDRQSWKTHLSRDERIQIQTSFERDKIKIELAKRADDFDPTRAADMSPAGVAFLRDAIALLKRPKAGRLGAAAPISPQPPAPLQLADQIGSLARTLTKQMIERTPALADKRAQLEAELAASLPTRIAAMRARVESDPASYGIGTLPHAQFARDGRYKALVERIDATYQRDPLRLVMDMLRGFGRTAMIDAAWMIEQRREPARSGAAEVFGSKAAGPNRRPLPARTAAVDPPANELDPATSVRVYPDMAMAALKCEQAGPMRLWLLCHHLDKRGSGSLTLEALREFVIGQTGVYSQRQLMTVLAQGEGAFWVRYRRKYEIVDVLGRKRVIDRTHLRLIGQGQVAVALGVERMRIHAVSVRLKELLGGMAAVSAALFASFHAGRGQTERFNAPIARATLEAISGCSPAAQRLHDKKAGTHIRRNYARTGILAPPGKPEVLAEARIKYGQAAFVVADRFVKRVAKGTGAIAVQLPNSYRSGPELSRVGQGRKRRINQALSAAGKSNLVGMGGQGNNIDLPYDKPLRRYFDSRELARKKHLERLAWAEKIEGRSSK